MQEGTESLASRPPDRLVTFWAWFVNGSGGYPGYQRVVDKWIVVHLLMGYLAASFIFVPLEEAARTVLLPLAGVFVGVSFAWGANASALLQSQEMEDMARMKGKGGFEEYVYTYQLAMLAILASLVLWGIAGLRFFDATWPASPDSMAYFFIKLAFYSSVSITLRESWHVALGAQMFLLARLHIRAARHRSKD